MPTIIELPQVGESVTEGVISKWLKEPGQHVDKYEPLVEIMTDKVNMEVPSPHAGTLVRTLVAEGDTVPMGEPICEMDVEDGATAEARGAEDRRESASGPSTGAGRADSLPSESGQPQRMAAPSSPSPSKGEGRGEGERHQAYTAARSFEFLDSVRSVGPTGSGEGGRGRPDAAQDAAAPRSPSASPPVLSGVEGEEGESGRARPRLSPLVQRLVRQHDVDAALVRATGSGGRITKDDVLRHLEQRGSSTRADAESSGKLKTGSVEGRERPSDAEPDATVLPLTALRRTIAAHVERSAREIPAAWSMVEADVTGLVACRDAHRERFERDHGLSLTFLPFAVRATALSLRENPLLNARWDSTHVTLHDRVHVGIAVATDGGLIVPVVRDADRLGVTELAVRIRELVDAARSGKLALDDVQGGTFTLDNTGALGSVVSVPIINHPQAAIITTEAVVKRPVVVEGDAVVARSMMNLCLTFDHRVCDGADAGRFLAAVRSRLEAIDEETALA